MAARLQPAAWPAQPTILTQPIPARLVKAFSQPAHTSSSSPGEYPVDVVDWQARLEAALSSKAAAADESRRRRRERQRIILAAELAQRAGGPAISVPQLTQADRQQIVRWRRQRAFAVLVAEDRLSGELLGSAAISLAQPEACLPPPFPTSKPRRVYVSNIAVVEEARRQGVATALLRQCERHARLWQQDSLWLHVELTNHAALQLYQRLGYLEVGRDPVFKPNRRCLMRKDVPRISNNISSVGGRWTAVGTSSSSGSDGAGGGGGSGHAAGVYVWSEELEEV